MTDFSWVFDATTPSTLLAAVKAMSPADIINGLFETMGGFFISLSIRKLHADKKVRGVSWVHAAFFSSWGYWNLYFYPHLDQWFSFAGGAFLVAANTFWLFQMFYWILRENAVALAINDALMATADEVITMHADGSVETRPGPMADERHLFGDPTLPLRKDYR